MQQANRRRVAILYGGRSGEHEISLRSAASVLRHLDRDRFEVVPIGIDRSGRWHHGELPQLEEGEEVLPVAEEAPDVLMTPWGSGDRPSVRRGGGGEALPVDVIFPVMHGPLCEDGTIQGLCELADLPYVGSGVLGSAVGMDKDVAKRLVAAAGIAVGPFATLRVERWNRRRGDDPLEPIRGDLARLQWPLFVKPANMGSSVGIHRVENEADLLTAIEDAFRYDTKILIEEGIDGREIELAVLGGRGDAEPRVSIPGEIVPHHAFYSYEAKYLDENGAGLVIPAPLTEKEIAEAQRVAREIFLTLECEGMARVDLFLDRRSRRFLFNEVNTLPGFTTISMYPKLWEASGMGYADLLTELIELAIERHERKHRLQREWSGGGTVEEGRP